MTCMPPKSGTMRKEHAELRQFSACGVFERLLTLEEADFDLGQDALGTVGKCLDVRVDSCPTGS
jgi:hypothetical protein